MDATQYQREMKKAKDSVDSLKKGKEMLAGASTKLIGALGLVTGGLEAMKMAIIVTGKQEGAQKIKKKMARKWKEN